jgi:hypothetical protein
MVHWKMVVSHTIIQILLMSCVYYVLLHALPACQPMTPVIWNDTLWMVISILTVILTFPVGWGVILMGGAFCKPAIFFLVIILAAFINSLFWNKLISPWWERGDECET